MTSRPPVELRHLCGDSAVAFGYALDITGTTVGRMAAKLKISSFEVYAALAFPERHPKTLAAIDKLIAQAKQMLTERVA